MTPKSLRRICCFPGPVLLLAALIATLSCKAGTPSTPSTPTSPLVTIGSFTVSPSTINKGQSATLSWSVTNATSISIDWGVGPVAASGTASVSPTLDTEYTLTAIAGTQTQTASVALKVILPNCEIYHTGVLHVTNLSSHGLDYNIIVDGVDKGRLKVNASVDFTLPAGPHAVDFKYSDHEGYGCPTSTPTVVQCQTVSIGCAM
jgi:hypothetical protein